MESPSPDTPFYEQPPFIIGMIILSIIILFVCFLLLLCFIRPRNKSEKYDISTLKSQGSPTREDGTVRASWGPLDTRMTVSIEKNNVCIHSLSLFSSLFLVIMKQWQIHKLDIHQRV